MTNETLNIETIDIPSSEVAKLKSHVKVQALCNTAAIIGTVAAIGKLADLETSTMIKTATAITALEIGGAVLSNYSAGSISEELAGFVNAHRDTATYIKSAARTATFTALVTGCVAGYKMIKED